MFPRAVGRYLQSPYGLLPSAPHRVKLYTMCPVQNVHYVSVLTGTRADARPRQPVRAPPVCRDESRHGTHVRAPLHLATCEKCRLNAPIRSRLCPKYSHARVFSVGRYSCEFLTSMSRISRARALIPPRRAGLLWHNGAF